MRPRLLSALLPLAPFASLAQAQSASPAPANCAELLARLPADSLWMRTETKREAEARAIGLHKKLDLDHDGYVTLDEINQFAKQRTAATGGADPGAVALVRPFFNQGDTNHDGRLSSAEAVAGADASFDRADTNHEGKVTPDEKCATMMKSVQQMKPRDSSASH